MSFGHDPECQRFELTGEQGHESDTGRLIGGFSEDDIVHLAHLEGGLVRHQTLGDGVLRIALEKTISD